MKSSGIQLSTNAMAWIQMLHQSCLSTGNRPLVNYRTDWLKFWQIAHTGSPIRPTGHELYRLLTDELGWRNYMAQGLVAEYDFAMELMDYLSPD